ncbi:hypothetical protein O3M35_011233 [Rhynocoris fuscipes]|uniref:Transmembrane protein 170A n=1 Tax=Rhynocoris fuscipes TaxID=488301 RepID=A0AAW1CVT8_9HEMI
MSSDVSSNSERTWQFDAFVDVIGLTPRVLSTFPEMWYQIFLWALFSSVLVHAIAAVIAFCTLRKHHFGKFFPIAILIMGVGGPLTSGVFTSAAIAFVYRASLHSMTPLYACIWGIGQTVLGAAVGFTRILATL